MAGPYTVCRLFSLLCIFDSRNEGFSERFILNFMVLNLYLHSIQCVFVGLLLTIRKGAYMRER
jgi:hypothetical protein